MLIQPQNKTAQKQTTQFLISKNGWLLWLSQLLNLSLISTELSWWMSAIIGLFLCWQALLLHYQKPEMNSWLLLLFAIGGCIAIAVSAAKLGVLVSMIHLLCYAYILKGFEVNNRKDFFQLSLLGLFILASSFIFNQSLLFTLVVLLILIVNLTGLLLFYSIHNTVKQSVKTTLILVLQSMLFAVVLFVVFPRLSPFWQVPTASAAKTGLSDTVSPGDIANLALSNDLAFRVKFSKQAPMYSQLYWRAMVLEHYDGRKWTRATYQSNNSVIETFTAKKTSKNSANKSTIEQVFNYQVTVQPSYQKWLFALPVATSSSSTIVQQSDYTLQNQNDISQIIRYQVRSDIKALKTAITTTIKQQNLQLPANSNPKLKDYAQQLRSRFSDPMAIAQAVLTNIRQQNYFYTLSPPLLQNNSLDQFFFATKSGFCVHYASTFTFIMRAAGIPARVVTGYLGGEYNNESEHFSIYQYDAHAWTEIWLEGKGWQRIDPTAAVDPQRVTSGLSASLLAQQSFLNQQFFSLHQYKQFAWLNTLRLRLDAMDYQWTRWVLGYSVDKQFSLLTTLFGEKPAWKIIIFIIFSLACSFLLFFIVSFLIKKTKPSKQTPWQLLYNQALIKLAKKGLIKEKHICVTDFIDIVATNYPLTKLSFERFSYSYNELAYQNLTLIQQQESLRTMVAEFKTFSLMLRNNKRST